MSEASIPMPMNLTIPLPPGMTPAQFQSLQGSAVTIAICVAVAAGIVFWDYVCLIPDELSLYAQMGVKILKSPSALAFILLRISGIIATLPALWFTSIQSNHCQSAVVASQVGAVFVVASSGLIFSYRVFSMWNSNRIIIGITVFMFTFMMACWIAVASQYDASNGPPTAFGSNCQMKAIARWAPISYGSSVLFDFTILIFTLLKLRANWSDAHNTVGFLVYRDSLLYFIATAVTNIVVLSIQALGDDQALLKPTAVPFSTLITTTMGARVFLNLKLFDQRKQRGQTGLPWSSQSRSGIETSHSSHPVLTFNSHEPEQPVAGQSFWSREGKQQDVSMESSTRRV